MEDDATNNDLVDLEGPRMYKFLHPVDQNGNPSLNLGEAQARAVEVERPTQRFLQVIFTLLTQRRVRLVSARESSQHLQEETIGWYDEDSIYLMPDAAYQAVSHFCRDSNEVFVLRQERPVLPVTATR
jgi:hypothetical protein